MTDEFADSTGRLEPRRRIVMAALAVARREDASAWTLNAVIREAGTSRSSFYQHFRGKDDLAAEMISAVARALVFSVSVAVEGEEEPSAWVDRMVEAQLDHQPGLARLVGCVAGAGQGVQRLAITRKASLSEIAELLRSKAHHALGTDPSWLLCESLVAMVDSASAKTESLAPSCQPNRRFLVDTILHTLGLATQAPHRANGPETRMTHTGGGETQVEEPGSKPAVDGRIPD